MGNEESREECVLNRVIRATEEGLQYEADQRHADIIVQAMKMSDCKPVTTAGEDSNDWQEEEDNLPLPKEQER